MINNDILRRFRYALDISDSAMIEMFKLGGHKTDKAALNAMLKKEEDAGYVACNDALMTAFLDGLILKKRGPREGSAAPAKAGDTRLRNNVILKKMRIALNLNEDDMLAIMKLAGVVISSSELSALFRRKDHKHYKECGDQFLRNFIQGLTIKNRGEKE
ncbi:MAG: hypothetical protein COV45_08480 [Deltaproteobacteria bacterium CG11_big_fil_rev_8_21_14_0_20_47_16]|nr:MAG: hypothetical protein COV45_08480 [Deltaproteobacteria bacterium CG11_big_fil_rev_8_21_14_0_20_47_16]